MEEKKIETINEAIPKKLLNPILDAEKNSRKLNRELHNLTIQILALRNRQEKTFKSLQTAGTSIRSKIERAFKKMKLGKKKQYNWRFDGKESFIGINRPEPTKKKEGK